MASKEMAQGMGKQERVCYGGREALQGRYPPPISKCFLFQMCACGSSVPLWHVETLVVVGKVVGGRERGRISSCHSQNKETNIREKIKA